MNITIQEDPALEETQVVIRCKQADAPVLEMIAALRSFDQNFDQKLTGLREGQTFLLDFHQVLYIDTADGRTFLYTKEQVYETSLRLYELEERLSGRQFLRASKSTLVNFNAIRSLRPDLGGRLRLTMRGGEALYVSRQYAPAFRKRLGL
ncbi:LytTR family DNA-binding domain-containing protein [Acutalibacter intestini]|uniref:LytTR family DNA-binding domain-containing protein n=1 Tax=Acutalibacter intestini TaxID=3093659 RepID=UPI002AC8CD1C|nr:LytTR family DNA-binding domain-containing protein [Acutalibacter sp. M00204]